MRRTFGAIALVTALLAVLPAEAGARAETTACEGALGPVVVEDLLVPEGATCTLDGTQVLGDVTVEADATLTAEFVRIGGSVMLASGSIFRIGDSAIDGDTTCTGCRELVMSFMFDPTDFVPVGGDVRATGIVDGHLHLEVGAIDGTVEVTDSSGDFTFIDNTIKRKFRFANNVGNAGFFFTSAGGDIEITGNTSAGGGFPADFELFSVHAGKDLVFSRNIGPSNLSENSAERTFECFENDPPPTGYGNTAGRRVEGQCAELIGPPPEG